VWIEIGPDSWPADVARTAEAPEPLNIDSDPPVFNPDDATMDTDPPSPPAPEDIDIDPPLSLLLSVEPPIRSTSPTFAFDDPVESNNDPEDPDVENPEPITISPLPVSLDDDINTTEPLDADILEPLKIKTDPPLAPIE